MRVGLMFPPGRDQTDLVRVARWAEELGFDYFCCGEHVFFHGPITNSFVGLAAAAGATERIRLLSALTVLPAYPAALAAKLIASLDQVARGRFDLGVGVGGEHPPEFEALGVALAERGRRTDEALELLAELFSGGRTTFHGGFTTIRDQALEPVPVQRPGPPVWVGGRRPAALRRAARYGDVWLPYLVDPGRLAMSLSEVRTRAAEYGRPPESVRGAVFCWAAVDSDPARARRNVLAEVGRTYRQDLSGRAERYLLYGTPEQVRRRIGEYAGAGAEEMVFAPACPAGEFDQMVDLFAGEVLPSIRAAQPATTPGGLVDA
ncbi:LLM class flavin-dependent oxidoreductase [Amycolatopsis alkalitolerans]|uniref:LLM class flavin-dependent oxidoreductase n=1 Tax=Amycolatopsis alkalitolerans TaxID=2547244 RepID=A0A5C4LXP9_9PSEU|nr:LLM class flavin-dependent oxidoreductase [Amycolatopsis alkalitolerans]TNC23778.1 LLM class flavin-dependent oxidoreductase [Amycolatopsis alkalitolerans]